MKIKAAIPVRYYVELKLDIKDSELINDLKNNILEGMEEWSEYSDEIWKQLKPEMDKINAMDGFEVDEDEEILYWIS